MGGTYVSIPGSHKFDITVYGKGTVIAGGGNDNIAITGKGKIVVGAGHDTLSLYKGGLISQVGGSGRDTIHIGSGTTTIYEQGHATVSGPYSSGDFGSATIFGGVLKVTELHGATESLEVTKDIAVSGKMTLLGSAAPTEFVGGTGSTSMVGGKGNDTFIGGSGHDTMVGGKGHDLFEFLSAEKSEGGHHLIKDFVSGQDHLYLEGHTLSYLEKHGEISTHGGNTYISLDGGKTTIELQGVTHLKSSDITGKH
jgi:Ca2+-binding RTX toxin-like protein